MRKWICTVCQYIYDPAVGDPEHGIPPGTDFDDLPDDWLCPKCMLLKNVFVPLDEWETREKPGAMEF